MIFHVLLRVKQPLKNWRVLVVFLLEPESTVTLIKDSFVWRVLQENTRITPIVHSVLDVNLVYIILTLEGKQRKYIRL